MYPAVPFTKVGVVISEDLQGLPMAYDRPAVMSSCCVFGAVMDRQGRMPLLVTFLRHVQHVCVLHALNVHPCDQHIRACRAAGKPSLVHRAQHDAMQEALWTA